MRIDPFTVFLAVLAVVSLGAALSGSRCGLVIPAGLAVLGALLYVTGEPTGDAGGDGDPQRIVGGVLTIVSLPWALSYILVAAVVRWRRRR